jgi:hypothetical protein
MPSLKNIHCGVYWNSTQNALTEFHPTYDDGCVDTWILVPEDMSGARGCDGQFYIQLNASGYIASGIAMFVCK